jgi:Uma2 family endonuclease
LGDAIINSRTFSTSSNLLTIMSATTLNLNPIIQLTKEQFYTLCEINPDTKLELNANGELIVMSPTGGETSAWNAQLIAALVNWNDRTGLGKVFDSSGGFSLPNGAQRSPDVAWIPLEKWKTLTSEEKRGFLPLCSDFIIELLSPSDSWLQGREKMAEYMDNGCRLGWLIEPKNKRVAIYRAKQTVEILESPSFLAGEDVLAGFKLNLATIWR